MCIFFIGGGLVKNFLGKVKTKDLTVFLFLEKQLAFPSYDCSNVIELFAGDF